MQDFLVYQYTHFGDNFNKFLRHLFLLQHVILKKDITNQTYGISPVFFYLCKSMNVLQKMQRTALER